MLFCRKFVVVRESVSVVNVYVMDLSSLVSFVKFAPEM